MKVLITYFLLLLLFIPSFAQADRDPLLLEAIEKMLNEEFLTSSTLIDRLQQKYPNDPAPSFFKGILTYGKSSYIADYKKYDKESITHWKMCIKQCDRYLKSNAEDVYALFFKGGSYGYIASLQTRKRRYLKAGLNVYKAMRCLYKALELDSTYWDIYYGMGLYHVTAANSPSILKIIQKILPIPNGNEERGFSYLETSYQKGHFSPFIVPSVLSFFYIYYRTDYKKAKQYIAPFLKKYPNGSDFMMVLASLYCHQGFTTGETDWQDLLRTIQKIENRFKSRSVKLRNYYRVKLLFFKGYTHFSLQQNNQAKYYLRSVVQQYKKNPYTGIAFTVLGMIEDSQGNRELALSYYKKADDYKKYGNVKEILSICLKQPYSPEHPRLILDDFFTLPDRS